MKRTRRLLLAFLVCGCASSPLDQAGVGAMTPRHIQAGSFVLFALVQETDPKEPVVIYIEGDGRAWSNRYAPAFDPTPSPAVALNLALLDRSPNRAYLARPCHYIKDGASCHATYWTGKRFSPEVIDAMEQAVGQIIGQKRGGHLVGYSGGGAVAALVAARRQDILSLRTIAGNLDTEESNRFHKVSAMPESLNPIESAKKLAALPQTHYVGEKDHVIPPFIAERFVTALGAPPTAQIVLVPGVSHDRGWEGVWRELH